jgi:hypothetical protein
MHCASSLADEPQFERALVIGRSPDSSNARRSDARKRGRPPVRAVRQACADARPKPRLLPNRDHT